MQYNLIIIGAGPAGYTAALRAGKLGIKVMLIDRDKLGGMCVNWGCIPAKS
ncbi:MAG: FAD-dependent oxidoreductase [Bacteroidales bacterium]|nr:FAD-dependent oxidoreductase [Bacteroidales bacterium]